MIPTITQDSFEKGIVFSAGAFVSSIVAVRIGIWLYHRSENPRDLIPGEKTMTSPRVASHPTPLSAAVSQSECFCSAVTGHAIAGGADGSPIC